MHKKRVIIIGAGPAGLTTGYELVNTEEYTPIIIESAEVVGGISKSVDFNGNQMDLGPHRFFSKAEYVTNLWKTLLPQEDSEKHDDVLLVKNRLTRIFFLRRFFNYPISLTINTIANLGFIRMAKIGFSYLKTLLFPIKHEKNLEDFFINRFGKELYLTFFKDYTEKVWGVSCTDIKPDWGAQRVKGLSIIKTIVHALGRKTNETSLVEQFFYPKMGSGQMWNKMAEHIQAKGGQILTNHRVISIKKEENKITRITAKNTLTQEISDFECNYCVSSMPIRDLVNSIDSNVPENIKSTANGLVYRDYKIIGLLVNSLKINMLDNWVYIQEQNVKIGRLVLFNNWSKYILKQPDKICLGLEYFCNDGDELWSMPDDEFIRFGAAELEKIDIIDTKEVIDGQVFYVPKAYPAYFGTYEQLDIIKNYINDIENLYLVGRNGMHRYNNMDHSMLSGMQAAQNIINNVVSKENIWNINTEETYHEAKK